MGRESSFSAAPTAAATLAAIIAAGSVSANRVLAGPTSGGAAAPTFRTLQIADVPIVVTTAAPTVNDDSGDGYAAGWLWLNTATSKLYIAISVAVGAAVWLDLAAPNTLTASGGASLTLAASLAAGKIAQISGSTIAGVNPSGMSSYQQIGATDGFPLKLYRPLPDLIGTQFSTVSIAANTLVGAPFLLESARTIDELMFAISSGHAASRVARMGIYSSINPARISYPDALEVETGEQDISTSGEKLVTGLSTVLPAGYYWRFYLCNNINIVPQCPNADNEMSAGREAGAISSFACARLDKAQAYGAMPARFPTGGAWNKGNKVPALLAHFSA